MLFPLIKPVSDTPSESLGQRQATPKRALSLNITNVRADESTIYVLVFAEEAAYTASDYTQAVGFAELSADNRILNAAFPELPQGRYAVTLFHDQNGDQDLNLNQQGYPIEGYGTSNASSKYDLLSFEDAVISAGQHSIEMFYLY